MPTMRDKIAIEYSIEANSGQMLRGTSPKDGVQGVVDPRADVVPLAAAFKADLTATSSR